ncbi:MAG: zinc carboxypeptidase [Pedobacter sp.]|nr:MAG: zinc carboxypeptidase [Pedobacter sp.]
MGGLFSSYAQVLSPEKFLGYPLGSKFTPHYQVINYFKHVSTQSNQAKLVSYGKTYEGRELVYAIVSDEQNINNIGAIQTQNLALASGKKEVTIANNQPSIVWFSYNVHGNESNSTETSMQVLYDLVSNGRPNINSWLKNTVVIIDPCLNPDGRDRYVNYYNSIVGRIPNADPMAREHSEPWPSGRPNHYYFDLNRDWVWQSQTESEQRIKVYREWMPQVHVDFHEQSYNDPYYFAPAAEPVHELVTPWQKEFQVKIGKNNAKYFDAQGWQYFTKERFDLLYPSYGDTYPMYNGAIGMTYEQGGIRAGLAVITNSGDTLKLSDRIAHHYTTSMSTIEVASLNSKELLKQFKSYFERNLISPSGTYKSFIVKADDSPRMQALADLLSKNGIQYSFGGNNKIFNGYNYDSQKLERVKLERNDMVVNLFQPQAVLANVLFEPNTKVTDSNTYDITAWALPFAYGLKAFGITEKISGEYSELAPINLGGTVEDGLAWALPYQGMTDAKVLSILQANGLRVRYAQKAFKVDGQLFPAGSLVIFKNENERIIPNLHVWIKNLQAKENINIKTIQTGLMEEGRDFGSGAYPIMNKAKVAIYSGDEVSSLAFGEVWHFFDQILGYPSTIIRSNNLGSLNINAINTLILPDGNYNDRMADQLSSWINAGGKLILLEDAIAAFVGKKGYDIKRKEPPKVEKEDLKPRVYADRFKDNLEEAIPGAIYKLNLDATHPMSAGLGNFYYTLKTDDRVYEPLANGWNIGILGIDSYKSGVVGNKLKKRFESGTLIAAQPMGRGSVIYFGVNPLFRSFWESGKQLFSNAVFMPN